MIQRGCWEKMLFTSLSKNTKLFSFLSMNKDKDISKECEYFNQI